MTTNRKSTYPITPLILNRWSPRAMTGEAMKEAEYLPLFEAARWAPSCYNEQPWLFLYAPRDSAHFALYLSLLVPFNQAWASKAALLGISLSHTTFTKTGKPSETHGYDTGAAWENLALEGANRGLVVHGMGGFDYARARVELKIPATHQVHAMFAVGKMAPKETLPADLQTREAPSDRKPLGEICYQGIFLK